VRLRARASFYDITFDIYVFRQLGQDEVNRIVAAYITGNRGGVVKNNLRNRQRRLTPYPNVTELTSPVLRSGAVASPRRSVGQ